MAVNRYTNVNWNAPMSSYVAPPLGMLQKIGETMQGKHEQALEDTYKLNDLMASVNAIDQHKPYKKQLEVKYLPKIDEITNKIVSGDNLTAQRDLNKLKRDWLNDPLRIELEQSYSDYGKELKDQAELKSKGLYTDVYNPFNGFTGSDETGNIQGYRYKGSRPVQDYLKVGQDLMKDIAKSGSHGKSYKIDPNTGDVIGLQNGWEAVYQKDVDRVAQNSIVPFLKSNQGQFFIDEYKHNNPNATQEDIILSANNYLRNLGNKQIFKDTEYGQDFKYAPEYIHSGSKVVLDELNKTTTTQSEALMNPEHKQFGEDFKFDSKGTIIAPKDEKVLVGHGGYDDYGKWDPNMPVYKTHKGANLAKLTEQIKAIDEIKRNNPALQGLSHKDVVDTYNKAKKSLDAESIPLESISNQAAKNIGDAISRNKIQRNFYLYDSKGKTEDGTLETVLNKLNIKEEDFDKALKSGIGGYTQAGPSAGSYYVDVKDSKGDSRRVMISPDNEMKTMFKTSQAVNEARKLMQPTIVRPFESNPNVIIAVNPIINKNGDVSWEYKKALLDDKGNILEQESTSLDEIRKEEKDVFKQSNYLGTQTAILKPHTTE